MNLFNCFQAVAFYTVTPLAIQWLFQNNYPVWGYIMSVGLLIGYIFMSIAIHSDSKS